MKCLFIVAALAALPLTAHAVTISPTFESGGCFINSFTSQGVTIAGNKFGFNNGDQLKLDSIGGTCSTRMTITMGGDRFKPVSFEASGGTISENPDFEWLVIEGHSSGEFVASQGISGFIGKHEFDPAFSGVDLLTMAVLHDGNDQTCENSIGTFMCSTLFFRGITLEPLGPAGDVSVVPLPPAGLLLISGIAALFGRRAIPWFRRWAS